MTFPTNYSVDWESWYSDEQDSLNNDVDKWADPVPRKVIGWTSRRVLSEDGTHDVEDTDHMKLQVPTDFTWNPQDHVTIPGHGKYEVVGATDANAGFHGWKPAVTLDVTKWSG